MCNYSNKRHKIQLVFIILLTRRRRPTLPLAVHVLVTSSSKSKSNDIYIYLSFSCHIKTPWLLFLSYYTYFTKCSWLFLVHLFHRTWTVYIIHVHIYSSIVTSMVGIPKNPSPSSISLLSYHTLIYMDVLCK